jgi:glutamyl-tRNA synthetase
MVEGTYRNKKTGEYLMATDEAGNPVLDENGQPVKAIVKRKMSKSQGDPSFEDLLEQGYLVEAVINYLVLLGWSPKGEREFFTLKELEEVFDLEGLSKSPSVFDIQKLNWFNAEYIRKLTPDEFLSVAAPWLRKALDPAKFDFRRIAELLQSRVEVLNQLPGMVDFLAEMPDFDSSLYTHKKMKTDPEIARAALAAIRPVLEGVSDWSETALHDAVMEAIPATGMKNGQILWPLRIAISGKASTPGGAFEIAYLLGREETLRRLNASIERLG